MLKRALPVLFVLAAALPPVTAQTVIAYRDFSVTTGLQLNDAQVSGSSAVLASSQSDRRGSVFTTSQLGVAQFSAVFQFRITSPGGISDGTAAGADGLTFTLQRVASTQLGQLGAGIGYGGINNSIAVEFDTFENNYDPSSNHIGINTHGSMSSLVTANVAQAFDDGTAWTVWVDYNGTVLEVRASRDGLRPAAATLTKTIDIAGTIGGSTAFLGFTAATGAAFGTHEVLGFGFSETYQVNGLAVPEPSTYALMGLGLVAVGWSVWRRRQ